MRVAVIGAGALGMLFGGKLAVMQDPAKIMIVAHSAAQSEQIAQQGIEVADNMQVLVSHPQSLTMKQLKETIAKQEESLQDWLFLTVKQQHIDTSLIDDVAEMMDECRTLQLLLFQNGIGHTEKFAARISPSRIFIAVTTEAGLKVSANRVIHTGKGTTALGGMSGDLQRAAAVCDDVKKLLREAGFSCVLSKNTESIVWNKLLINAVINPLTALWGIPNGELLTSPERLAWMRALLDEGMEVAGAIDVHVAENLWEQLLNVCRKTAENSSSMLQDVLAGRPTELAWINGEIVRIAHGKGVSVPTHEKVFDLLKGMPGFLR